MLWSFFEKGQGLPFPFSKTGEKKYPNCGHLWLKVLIQNEIFKTFQAKKPDTFSLSLSHVVGKYLSKCLISKKTSLP